MRRLLIAAPLLMLAACGGNEPAPEPTDNAVEELDVTNEAAAVPEAPTPTPTPTATPTPVETAAPVPDDEQVQADAEATGMTARVSRDEAPAAAADDAQPVEERK